MARFGWLKRYFGPVTGVDTSFEHYYGSIVRKRPHGAPSVAEARRDFEPVRRVLDKAVYY